MKTDSSEMSIDTAIYHAATILTAVTGEVVALSQLIFRQMDKQFSQNGIQCGRAFEQTTTGRAVRARWFHKPISFTEPNDVANGHLTLVFDFGVENGLSGKIKAPILFVCWYPGPLIKWETWEIGSFEGEELAKVHQSRNGIAGYGQTVERPHDGVIHQHLERLVAGHVPPLGRAERDGVGARGERRRLADTPLLLEERHLSALRGGRVAGRERAAVRRLPGRPGELPRRPRRGVRERTRGQRHRLEPGVDDPECRGHRSVFERLQSEFRPGPAAEGLPLRRRPA